MGCRHSKDATRADSIAAPLRPTTPSFHAHDSKLWTNTSGSQANQFREELPSFVVSDSADLVGSSDGEPVHGMVSAFTFSFIQASETSSTNSSLSLDSSFVSEDQASPGPPESLTFAMTSDPIELLPIPEEHSGPRGSVEASTSTTAELQESAAPTPTESGVTEPEEEWSPAALVQMVESSAVSESATTETSDLLVNELDASESSNATRRSVTASELSEGGEYIVTETGAVVRQEPEIDPVPEASNDGDVIERESIEEVVAAIVQDVVHEALADGEPKQPRDRAALVARSSLLVEPSSTGIFALSMKTQPSENAPVASSRVPIYAIVGTSTDKGVVLYQIQLLDEVTDSATWSAPLSRRYSRFSEMHSKLKETKLPAADSLPKLPRASVVHFVRGRQSKKTIEERQQQFSNLLRYIAEHRELHDSTEFQCFLATAS
ncbi:hypothetical protein PRNP1_006543 [Phytophthora ramorum]